MLNIAIDLGSYSVKFVQFSVDKKQINALSTYEVILDIPENSNLGDHDLWDNQVSSIRNYLNEIKQEFQIVMNMNSEIISTRFLNVPAKNKKRANMMLSFLIEEDLPFPISACHFSAAIDVEKNHCDITAGVIKKEHFDDFFQILTDYQVEPKVLTNDVSIYRSYIKNNVADYPDSFCILEFGHEATRGYFFHRGKLVANHHSFVAGKLITEDISKTYGISIEEATIYKHQNAFVLTEGQFEDVNNNQKEFAKLMDTTLQPLINELRRWEIGFRVKHGVTINDYFICGGTANINNFSQFISSKLGSNVSPFNPYLTCKDKNIDSDSKFRNKFTQVSTLMQGMNSKNQLINFLKGDYSFQSNENLPIENIAFIGLRIFILTFIASTYLLINQVITNSESKQTTKKISTQLKGPIYDISPREKKAKTIEQNPKNVLNKLTKQDSLIQQEIKMIQSSVKTNALDPLEFIASISTEYGKTVELIQFHSLSGKEFDFTLQVTNAADLEKIQESLEASKKFNLNVDVEVSKKQLIVTGEVE